MTEIRKPSQSQISLYLKICAKKKVLPKNYKNMSYDELNTEIKSVNYFKNATPAQLDLIEKKIKVLIECGSNIKYLSDMEKEQLSIGDASEMLKFLINEEGKHNAVRKPSDAQLDIITSWLLCPSIPFEQENINTFIPLEEEGLKRRMTLCEFKEELNEKFTYKTASKFIDENKTEFYKWSNSRIKKESKQWNFIRELEQRMANVYMPKEITYALDDNGEMIRISKCSTEWNPEGFTPLSDNDLTMFDSKTAGEYIQMLQAELKAKNKTSVNKEDTTFEELRPQLKNLTAVRNQEDANIQQFELLNDLMFALESIAGYEDPELHQASISLLIHENADSETIQDCKDKIRGFMLDLLKCNAIEFSTLAKMVENCQVAQNILLQC